jgi:threonine/homoserine/homoserine lactone efflux protein
LATTLINPKGLIFAFAIFPEIPVSRLLPWFAEFTVLVLIAAFAWTAAGAMIARSAGTLATPCRIRRTAALALVAFAAIFVRSALASAF